MTLPRPTPLAAALLTAVSALALAETAAAQRTPTDLDAIEVHESRIKKASSPKYTEKLVDTPQTITVVSKQTMDQQNLIGLRDVLSTLPGITFGAGEGGGGYGDSINLRGFTASSDITTDGVRDSAQYTRSDNFNLESIELVNGANSAYSGAGSVGGNINLVNKRAQQGDDSTFTLGAGTDAYRRVTADSNIDFDNGTALRLNAMGHARDVPGRDHEFDHRWGFAPSIAFGLGSDTRFTLSYFHQSDRSVPQYGVPYALNAFNNGPLPGVDPETYFGYRNTSRQEIDVDMLTGVFEADFGDHLRLRSLGRLQRVDQITNVSALQGDWCRFDGSNPFTGGRCLSSQTDARGNPVVVALPPGSWSPTAGSRGNVRDTRNFIASSQTDLSADFVTGAVGHALVAGVSLSREDFELDGGNGFRNADGSAPPNDNTAYPLQDLDNPYNIWTGPTRLLRTSRSEGELSNQAVYLFDTLKFGERWMLNLGGRYEHNEGSTTNFVVAPNGSLAGVQPSNPFRNEDDLFSYRAGVVFKPTQNGTLYLSYANSKAPSKASVNGACSLQTCNVDPETAVNVELGSKWEVLDQQLTLTAAIFRNERQNYKVADPANPDNPSGEQQLDGEARVEGVALGAAGRITPAWSLFANYTYLDSEVVRGVSRFCLDNPEPACSNSAALPDPFAGNPLTNTPKHSGSVWTTYALGDWTFGYGATYQGSFVTQNNRLTSPVLYQTPNYWVHRAMVAWQVSDSLSLQLNLNNLFDEEYYLRIRNTATSGWATPGEARSAVLTASYRF
ncbi:MAG: TonB-dependent receptor [Luteimonas sp.]